MQFSPSLDESLLAARELSGQHFNCINGENQFCSLINRMQMWTMMTRTMLGVHPNANTEESRQLSHSCSLKASEMSRYSNPFRIPALRWLSFPSPNSAPGTRTSAVRPPCCETD